MTSWWRRWAGRLTTSAVPVDGDPGAWRKPSVRKNSRGRRVRPDLPEPWMGTRGVDTIERALWRDVHIPPPAA